MAADNKQSCFLTQLDDVHRLMLDTLSTERGKARGAIIRQLIRDEYFKGSKREKLMALVSSR